MGECLEVKSKLGIEDTLHSECLTVVTNRVS